MSTYLSPLFFKARTDADTFVRNHVLTASDFGLYYVLMCVSKRDLLDGKLTLRAVAHESRNLHFRAWKPAIEKLLEAGLITEITDTYVQLDWTGQTTREAIEKRSVTREDGTHDIARMHDNDDHTYCRKPHCDIATKWAKGYDENGKKGVTRKVTAPVTNDDPTGNHPPVAQSQNQRQRQKDSGSGNDDTAAPTLTPGGDAPYSPDENNPSEAGAPVADTKPPTRPRTPIAEIDFQNFDLHDVIERTEVVVYEYPDDGDCQVEALMSLTEDVMALCDTDEERFEQICAKITERVGWIRTGLARQLPEAREINVCEFTEDLFTVELSEIEIVNRDRTVEIVEDALSEAGLSPVARE